MIKKLNRLKDAPIAGVCGGLGNFFDIDPVLFRILFFIGIFTPYPAILTYIICWITIPKEKFVQN